MRRAAGRSSLLKKKRTGVITKPALIRKSTSRTSSSVYYSLRASGGRGRVLIIRALGGIGDVLMVTPLLRQLKTDFPNAELTFAIDRISTRPHDTYHELIKNAPFIDRIVEARHVDKNQWDIWADVTSVCIRYENKRLPPLNRIDIFARHVGIPRLSDPVPFYRVEGSERLWARELMNTRKKKLVLHTASFDGKRTWPASHNQELLRLLAADQNLQVYLFDYNNTVTAPEGVINCSSYSIRQKAAIIEQSDLFVGPDSGPMHLAGALRKKSLVIFGPIPPEARLDHYPTHRPVLAPQRLACQYCWYSRCNIGIKCLSDITAAQVLQQIQETLR